MLKSKKNVALSHHKIAIGNKIFIFDKNNLIIVDERSKIIEVKLLALYDDNDPE
jgi:hypothetical protein